MAFRLALTERNAAVNAILALFKTGPNPASIKIYSDTTSQPPTPETALPVGSVLLATVNFASGSGAFANVTNGTGIPSGLPLSATVQTAGTAAWFAFMDGSSGTALPLGTGTVTLAAGSGDMIFDTVTWSSGGTININSLSFTVPM